MTHAPGLVVGAGPALAPETTSGASPGGTSPGSDDAGSGITIDMDELACRITALDEHPVVQYVRELPLESASYPANMYHKSAGGDGGDDSEDAGLDCMTDDRSYAGVKGLITWSPPGRDADRPRIRGCGFIREKGSRGEEGIHYIACSEDREHYAKGRRMHCWSLHCPSCMNDEALRTGTQVEEHLLSYRVLMEKQGADPGPLGHWAISPPQDDAKEMMQTIDGYNGLRKHIEERLMDCGAKTGVLVFHPWKQGTDMWRLAPHFHSVLFGFIDTDGFRESDPGLVIKKVHKDECMESIGQTVAYLMTHAGLGMVEKDADDTDYDLRFLNHMLPGLTDCSGTKEEESMFRYTDDDRVDMVAGKGRMVGDISGIDWIEFTKKPLFSATRITYFGKASKRNLVTVANEREYRTRLCRECGQPLNIYTGLCDVHGKATTFLYDNRIKAFREDSDDVKAAIDEIREELRSDGLSLGSISGDVALMVARDEVSQSDYRK